MKRKWISALLLVISILLIAYGINSERNYERQEAEADEQDLQIRLIHESGNSGDAENENIIQAYDPIMVDDELPSPQIAREEVSPEKATEMGDIVDDVDNNERSSGEWEGVPTVKPSIVPKTSVAPRTEKTPVVTVRPSKAPSSQGQPDTINEPEITDLNQEEAADSAEPTATPSPEPTVKVSEGLLKLHKQNSDCVAWIKISGTAIDYPVMHKPNSTDYYIHKDFNGKYSARGSLYLSEICNIDRSSNLIIYGHNMKNGTMFAALTKYKSKSFYSGHRYITLETLSGTRTYEVICALTTSVSAGTSFKYYNFSYASSEESFNNYLNACKSRALYETGVTAVYGQQLLTLSTCEYSQTNGRMLVVAKRIK